MLRRTRTAQIEADLRARIDAGTYDEQLPTLVQLREEFGVAKATMDTVLARLESSGVIIRIQGSGIYVRPRQVVVRNLLEDVRLEYRLARSGGGGDIGLFEQMTGVDVTVDAAYRHLPADVRIAEALAIPVGTEVLERTFRYRLGGGVPHQIAYGWMPADLAARAGLTDPGVERPGVGTMSQLINAGVRLTRLRPRIGARMPTPDEVTELAIPRGTPVFELWRVLYGGDPEAPVEAGVRIQPSHQVEYVLDIDLEATR